MNKPNIGKSLATRFCPLLLALVPGWIAVGAMAAESFPTKPLTLDVEVQVLQQETFSAALGSSLPYHFNARLQVAEEGYWLPCNDTVFVDIPVVAACPPPSPLKGDFYFGVIPPGANAYSWVEGEGGVDLQQGLAAIATDLDLSKELLFDLNASVGDIQHVFSTENSPGMYSVFALLVKAGTNPADTRNWIEAEMQPLIAQWPIIDQFPQPALTVLPGNSPAELPTQ